MALAGKKSPAFQFYAADYLADEHVALMTLEEEGVYIRLLAYCWREGSIPADPKALSRLCKGASPESILVVSDRFEPMETDPSRLTHSRLNVEREKQENWSRKNSENGKRGGRPKKTKSVTGKATAFSGLSETKAKKSSSFSFSSSNKNSFPNGKVAANAAPSPRPEDFANVWNRERGTLPKVAEFTEDRRRKTKVRINAGLTLERFSAAVARCRGVPFLNGDNERGWRVDYDWLMKNGTNMAKVMEGRYDGDGAKSGTRIRSKTDGNLEALRQAIEGFDHGDADGTGDLSAGGDRGGGLTALRQTPVVLPATRCGDGSGADFP